MPHKHSHSSTGDKYRILHTSEPIAVTTIFLEITRKILGIVQLLHFNSNSIDGLRILMWTDCQCRTKVVKTKLNHLFNSLVQTKIITYLATVSPLWLISQMLGSFEKFLRAIVSFQIPHSLTCYLVEITDKLGSHSCSPLVFRLWMNIGIGKIDGNIRILCQIFQRISRTWRATNMHENLGTNSR